MIKLDIVALMEQRKEEKKIGNEQEKMEKSKKTISWKKNELQQSAKEKKPAKKQQLKIRGNEEVLAEKKRAYPSAI